MARDGASAGVARGRGSAGGASNEAGSIHRAGVAAYLAVHGLTDREVEGRTGCVPVRIGLETLDATDDIVCEMVNGSSWFFQCKRTVGNDRKLRDAAGQWGRQELGTRDFVVLGARELRGPLKTVQPILRRTGAVLSPKQERDRSTVLDTLNGVAPGRGEAILEQLHLFSWAVEEDADYQSQLAAALLEAGLVPPGLGMRAFRQLRAHLQSLAARRQASDLEDWVGALTVGGVEVFSDGEGPAGSRLRAEQVAISEYREGLSRNLDRLDVSSLTPDLSEVHVKDLSSGFQVEFVAEDGERSSTEGLHVLARRNERFIVTGLPGMGKSTAFRQLTARLAADDSAPVPLHVDLRRLSRHVFRQDDVSVDLLLRELSQGTLTADPAILHRGLRRRLEAGDALLLLDGLDETMDRAGSVAAGLADLLDRLPPSCGFLLSSRHNALTAAGRMGLPVVELVSPPTLERTMRALLAGLGRLTRPSGDFEKWADERQAALTQLSKEAGPMWDVPLLATLLTIRVAKGKTDLPNAATLLNDVVEDSVLNWERHRGPQPPWGAAPEMRPQMLLDGFAALGHALNTQATLSREDANRDVASALASWGHSGRVLEALAREITWFWDEVVGVFLDRQGNIEARSRQFAELGDARWAANQDPARRRSWMEAALANPAKRDTVRLAAVRDPEMTQLLFEAAASPESDKRLRALSWLYYFFGDTSPASSDEALTLLELMLEAASQGLLPEHDHDSDGTLRDFLATAARSRDAFDGPGWSFALRAASIPIPSFRRQERDGKLADLRLDTDRVSILRSTAMLSDARADGRTDLSPEQVKVIQSALYVALPEHREPVKILGKPLMIGGASRPIHSGLAEVAERAIPFLDQLGPATWERIFEIAGASRVPDWRRITARMSEAGYVNPRQRWPSIPKAFREHYEDHHGLGWLFRLLNREDPGESSESSVHIWRWRALADLVSAIGWRTSAGGDSIEAAAESPAVLAAWLDATMTAADISVADVASESARLLAPVVDIDEVLDVIIAYGFHSPHMDAGRLTETQQLKLVQCLMSRSEWISRTACLLLVDQGSEAVAAAIRQSQVRTNPRSRWYATIALCANSASAEADVRRIMADSNSPARLGAARFLRLRGDEASSPLLAQALVDEDLTVRVEAGAREEGVPAPAYWSCRFCATRNDIESHDVCTGCDSSSRPKPREDGD
jgi:hypothetical protein